MKNGKRILTFAIAVMMYLGIWTVPVNAQGVTCKTEKVNVGGVELSEETSVTEVPENLECAENEILVVFKDGVKKTEAEETTDGCSDEIDLVETPIENEVGVITVEQTDVEEALSKYLADPNVAYVQPNVRYKVFSASTQLNDEYKDYLWHLDKIQALDTWNYMTNIAHKKVRVAVVDTGVDVLQPDVRNSLNRSLSRDIVGGGKISSDVGGCDHGTNVAGIIAAQANNKIGGAGVAGDGSFVELVAVRAGDDRGDMYSDDILEAIKYAIDIDARVINMSFGSTESLPAEKAILEKAADRGIVLVAAAGNEGNTVKMYPAAYSRVISVINTDSSDKRNSSSTYGSWCDISAPGTDILVPCSETEEFSRRSGGIYGLATGTSEAAPVVTGVVAMMLSANENLSADEVKSILCATADDIGAAGKDAATGYGRVNALKATKKAVSEKVAIPSIKSVSASGTSALKVTWKKASGANRYKILRATKKNGTYKTVATIKGASKTVYTDKKLTAGKTYYYKIAAYGTVNGKTKRIAISAAKGRRLVPQKVSGLKAAKKTSRSVRLTWKKISGASGYAVYAATSRNGAYKRLGYVAPSKQTYTAKGLKKGKTYYFKVRAYKTVKDKKIWGTLSGYAKKTI